MEDYFEKIKFIFVFSIVIQFPFLFAYENTKIEEIAFWQSRYDELSKAIKDNFWLEEKGYFAAYILSNVNEYVYEGYETLGESFSILNALTDKNNSKRVINAVESGNWGMSVVTPQLSNVPPYYNDAVWPFVQGYRGLASKNAGDVAFEIVIEMEKSSDFVNSYDLKNREKSLFKAADFSPAIPNTFVESSKNTTFYEAEKSDFSGGNLGYEEDMENALYAKTSADLQKVLSNEGGFIEKWGSSKEDFITFNVTVKKEGFYVVDFRFKNGHGPVNTGEKCAIKSLL